MKTYFKKPYNIIYSILFVLLYYYIVLPPININSLGFWMSLFINVTVVTLMNGASHFSTYGAFTKEGLFIKNKNFVKRNRYVYILITEVILIIILVLTNIILSPVFNSKSYANRIYVEEDANFTEDVSEVDFNNLALLDKDSSTKLGDRTMGQMPELVSQYDISNTYTQIRYKDKIERVTPLEYDDVIKSFTNKDKGITGYVRVNSATGSSKLERLDKGIKYAHSAILNNNLYRKLRFSYPFDSFGEFKFEIDDNKKPFWIIPVIDYKGVGLLANTSHIIIFDPVSGESTKYDVESVPSWVDNVYEAHIILDQLDDWGKFRSGFINATIGQKNVVATTEGYNYLVMDDGLYLTTGITSRGNDEANIGFVLTNLRTKETKFYQVAGAEEYSAMDSALGQVQQMNYRATFPILINLNNKPTYVISLKDYAGLVKMYAFVDLEDYQKVSVSDSSKGIKHAASVYLKDDVNNSKNQKEKTITIKEIYNNVIDSTTYFYIVDINNDKYKVSIKVNDEKLPFVKINDKLNIKYIEGSINTITNIK